MNPLKHKVRMLKTEPGCDDGVVITEIYREGQEYEIGTSLLDCFVDRGAVELVDEKPRIEAKSDAPDENKAIASTPENKSSKKKRK